MGSGHASRADRHSRRSTFRGRKATFERLEEKWAIGSLLLGLPGSDLSGMLLGRTLLGQRLDISILPEPPGASTELAGLSLHGRASSFLRSNDTPLAGLSPLLPTNESALPPDTSGSTGANSTAFGAESDNSFDFARDSRWAMPSLWAAIAFGADSGADLTFRPLDTAHASSSSSIPITLSQFDSSGEPAGARVQESPVSAKSSSNAPSAPTPATSAASAPDAPVASNGNDLPQDALTSGDILDGGAPVAMSGFAADFSGWSFEEFGGSDIGKGRVENSTGNAILYEGNSFLVTFEHTFEVPTEASELSFSYTDLHLDPDDPDSINDAFEVALIDSDGSSLVHTTEPDRDGFYNVTEDLPAAMGSSASEDSGTVTVDLGDVFAGTTATLVFRLVNNDSDTGSHVTITGVSIPGEDEPPVVDCSLANDTAPSDVAPDSPYRSDLLTNDPMITGTVTDDVGIAFLEAQIDSAVPIDITISLVGSSFQYDPGVLSPGPHSITIRATDTYGHLVTDTVDFTTNTLPLAHAGSDITIPEGTSAALDGSGSSDFDAPIHAFLWTFEDASTAEGPTASRFYGQQGEHSVTLTITDTAGSEATDVVEVTVEDLGPTAAFAWMPEPQAEGALVSFTNESTSSPDGIVSWSWDFDGLGTSTDQNPSFTFADNGAHTVTLTVTDEDGSTDTASHLVTVTDLAPTAAFTWAPEPQAEGSERKTKTYRHKPHRMRYNARCFRGILASPFRYYNQAA